MYTPAFAESLKHLEEVLRFPSFDLEDAYALGTRLREAGTREPEPIAVRIVLDDLIVYQTFLPGTGKDNNWWMDKKYATVKRTHHSSLLAAAERELASSREDWQCDELPHRGGRPVPGSRHRLRSAPSGRSPLLDGDHRRLFGQDHLSTQIHPGSPPLPG